MQGGIRAVDCLGLADEGDDAHCRCATPGTPEGLDFGNSARQFRPASLCLAHGLGFRLYGDEREFRANLVSFGRLASHTPHPRRVVAIVTLENLVFVRDMAGEFGEELECVSGLTARGRSRGLV